jgi:hypothetical protein
VLIAITGFEAAKHPIRLAAKNAGFASFSIHICDPLDDSDRLFNELSKVFPDPNERAEAEDIAHRFGRDLVKDNPLGYGNSQAAIVFEENCPNNSLPILWSDRGNWRPLFPRST